VDVHINSKKMGYVEDILPLTRMQKEILFSHLMNPDSDEYYEQQCYLLSGDIDPIKMEQAWKIVVKNNEMLRVAICYEKLSEPVQVIWKVKNIPIHYYDFTKQGDPVHCLKRMCEEEWLRKVDITKNPFRVTLCKCSNMEFYMILSSHHIILDGWSNAVLLSELYEAYGALLYNKPIVDKNKSKFKSYVKMSLAREKKKPLLFWNEYLQGYVEHSAKTQKEVDEGLGEKTGIVYHRFKNTQNKRLMDFVHKNEITQAGLFYGLWGLACMKCDGIRDVLFGITLSGRNYELIGMMEMVGLFIRTIPIRIKVSESMNALEYIRKISRDVFKLEENQHIYLPDVLTRNSYGRVNLLNSVVVLQNYKLERAVMEDKENLFKISLYSSRYATNLNMVLGVKCFGDYLEVEFNYRTSMYRKQEVEKLCSLYTQYILKILEESDTLTVSDILRMDVG
jgi:hypothetical protein